jgi:hypothetical protein
MPEIQITSTENLETLKRNNINYYESVRENAKEIVSLAHKNSDDEVSYLAGMILTSIFEREVAEKYSYA